MRRLAAVFVLALLIGLVVTAPLRLVTIAAGGQDAIGYSAVHGTVWDGRIYGPRIAGAPLREVGLGLRPLALATGRLALDWRVDDVQARGSGVAWLAPGGRQGLAATELTLTLARLGVAPLPGLDLSEPVFIEIDRLEMRRWTCLRAEGGVRTNALYVLADNLGVDGPVLEGDLTCRGEDLALDFAGESADLSLAGELVFRPAGAAWSVEARTGDAEIADALALAGLEREGDHWTGSGLIEWRSAQ